MRELKRDVLFLFDGSHNLTVHPIDSAPWQDCRINRRLIRVGVCSQGNDYFQTEYDRLERLMSSAASPAKLAEIARKSSVLSAFIPSLNTEVPLCYPFIH